jgi:hypothetical protein
MAARAKASPEDISQVRVPGKLLAGLSYFLNSLHNPIVREAVGRAHTRKAGPEPKLVNSEDILVAAQTVLPSSLAKLVESLQSYGTRHARRKAS